MLTTQTIEILASDFVLQGLKAALIAGLVCGLLGPFFVWKRLALFGSAVSHAALTPIAIAQIIQIPFVALLFPFSAGLSVIMAKLEEKGFTELDSVLSVFFTGLMALGIILMTMAGRGSSDAVHYLFGDILLVDNQELLILIAVSLLVLWYISISWKDLVLIVLNRDLAIVEGVPVRRHSYILMILSALTVACTLVIMGVILSTTLLIVPPLVARGFSGTLRNHILISILVGMAMSTGGLVAAALLDVSSGPMIAVIGLLVFLGSSLFRKASI